MGNNTMRACGEIYPTDVWQRLHYKVKYIAIIGLVSASLSFIGSISIISFILWKKLLKSKRIHPLFHLSLADLILSFFWIVSTVNYFRGADREFRHPEYYAISCFVWQLLTEIIHLVTFFLTINYSVNVVFKMKDRTLQVHMISEADESPHSISRLYKVLYISSWCLPIMLMMPIIVNIRRDSISACQKCVILIDVPVLECGKVQSSYGYIVLALSLTFSTLTIIMLYSSTLRMYWKAVPGFHTDRQRKQLANMQARITLYVLVFIICWAPAMMISYHKWANHPNSAGFRDVDKYFGLFVFQAICAPLQGLLNSIVYGWTKKYFRKADTLISPVVTRQESFTTRNYDFSSQQSHEETSSEHIINGVQPPLAF